MTKPIISFIALLLSVVFALFYVKPEYDLVQQRRGDIATLTGILNNSSKIKTLIDQTTTNLNTVDNNELLRFSTFLPESIDPIRFANTIQHIGLMSGIVLQGIKIDPTPGSTSDVGTPGDGGSAGTTNSGSASGGSKYLATKASFTLSTTYDTFQTFLRNLERSLGLMNVTTLSFSSVVQAKNTKSATGPQQYQYDVTIETYSLK